MRARTRVQVLVLGAMQAEAYRGEGDPSQEPLVYCLRTEASRAASAEASASASASQQAVGAPPPRPPVPYLPTGNVLGGLTAALLSYFQARCMAADAVVSVDMVPGLCAETVGPLAAAAGALLLAAAVPGAGVAAAGALAAAAGPARRAIEPLAGQLGLGPVFA